VTRSLLISAVCLPFCVAADRAPAPPPKPVSPAAPRMQAAGMRNENVAVNQIDNNAIKEANVRLGVTPTVILEHRAETTHYATEFGRPAGSLAVMGSATAAPGWHGEVFHLHQNSVFNARTFFQVGSVKPSRRNQYGGRFSGRLSETTWVSGSYVQRDVRGMVNGNVLVPLAAERTPRSNDPAVRALVERFLKAYPAELPNRPDFDPRALNTNAPQRLDDVDASVRLDHDLGGNHGRVSASYNWNRQRVDAFQLVAGQNPDNELHPHRGQAGWRGRLGGGLDAAVGVTFQRTKTVLVPEPNAVPMRVRIGYQIEELGPDSEFPVDRATNSYRYGAVLSRRVGAAHELTFGGDLLRFQLNGIETSSTRGFFSFTNNFGRTAIENFLMGTPAFYEVTMGELSRGFRNWTANGFVADRWKMNGRVQLYVGLRYNLVTGPTEVNGYHARLYPCDCNNFSPRVSLAVTASREWMLRAAYTTSFAEVPPVTYQQVRFNLPWVRYVQVQNPNLLNPLAGANPARSSPTMLSKLVSPYAHQYSLSAERKLVSGAMVRLGYLGSRSFKMMLPYIMNRAEAVAGIPLTLGTVDERRPDATKYEVRHIVNGGIAYFDGVQASVELPGWRGLRAAASYTFSKAIDEGTDYTSTAANRDLSRGRSQWQYDSLRDRKGLSNFDSPHSALLTYSYDLPRLTSRNGAWSAMLNNWQVAGVSLVKSGTPLTLYIGSDAPGFGNVDGGPGDRPHILDPSILGKTIGHPDTAPLILRRERFGYLAPGEQRGNLGKNTFRKARIANWNAALTKQWIWNNHGEWRFQFRMEAYNLTNTPQFDEPQRNLTSPAFGRITNTLNDGRVFQLALRVAI
jgi:hypothetical protein